MSIRKRNIDNNVPTSAQDVPYAKHNDLANGYGKYIAEMYCGTVTGTGASLDVACPFDPAVVEIVNQTQLASFKKLPSMGTSYALKEVTAGTKTYASGCITLGTGKFTIGTDAAANTASDVIHFVAWGAPVNGGS